MICKDCLKYKMHKDQCWFYWDDKMACSRFEDTQGERFNKCEEDFESLMQKHIESK